LIVQKYKNKVDIEQSLKLFRNYIKQESVNYTFSEYLKLSKSYNHDVELLKQIIKVFEDYQNDIIKNSQSI